MCAFSLLQKQENGKTRWGFIRFCVAAVLLPAPVGGESDNAEEIKRKWHDRFRLRRCVGKEACWAYL